MSNQIREYVPLTLTIAIIAIVSGCYHFVTWSTGFPIGWASDGCHRTGHPELVVGPMFKELFGFDLLYVAHIENAGETGAKSPRIFWISVAADDAVWAQVHSAIEAANRDHARPHTWYIRSTTEDDPNWSNITPIWWPAPGTGKFQSIATEDLGGQGVNRGIYPTYFNLGYDRQSKRIFISYETG